MKDDGIIRILFREQYKKAFSEFYPQSPLPLPEDIEKVQGYYFARNGACDFLRGCMFKNFYFHT
jgi:hypothetical protein